MGAAVRRRSLDYAAPRMPAFVDLHCHWIAGIDDGARTVEEGIAMLAALQQIGFERVIATPHMRPGMFDNTRDDLLAAFERMQPHLSERQSLPDVALSSEHYFDDVVFERLREGRALPYPGGRAALLEFYEIEFFGSTAHRLFDLQQRRLLPVIAHPERYRRLWREPDELERLTDAGSAALLDAAALVGKYGREPQRCSEELLERGLYHAACSDAHRVADVDDVARAMALIERRYGAEELDFLFHDGPLALLDGRLPQGL
jgi:protein-tyrosine phosphatase